nr:transposase [Actinomyces oris]
MWRHTRRGDRYVTVIIDLTPVRDRSGPARLVDVVPGRSKKPLQDLALPARPGMAWAGRGGSHGAVSPGPKSAAGEELPHPRAVMDPFHVVSLAASKLDQCRRRIQRAITGRRGRAGDQLYRARRTLHTGADLLTDTQTERLETLFADDRHAAVQASWGVYQHLIQAYRTDEAGLGKYLTQQLIDSLKQAIPEGLEEIHTLARTPISRSQDVLAYFDRPRTSNGPTPGHQRTPGAPTRHRPGICATWPATPSAASSTPAASKTT